MKSIKLTYKQSFMPASFAVAIGLSYSGIASAIEVSERTDVNVSGKIVGAVIADSDVSGMGVNNLPNALFGKSDEANIAIDTTLTRLNFGTTTQFENDETVNSFLSFDFANSNNGKMDLRIREAYINWQIGNGSLLVGQTWSTLMDLNRFPDTLLEPTLSGVVFTRQPMIRWSQSLGDFRYDIALESGSNRVETDNSETDLDNTTDIPDFVFGLQTSTEDYWLRAAGVINHITTSIKKDSSQGTESQSFNDTGWGVQLSGGIKFNEKDHFQVSYFTSRGNDRYVLGVSQTGPLFSEDTNEFHLRESQALWTAIGHSWTKTLKSTFGYGIWSAEEFDWQNDTFTETQFALANLKWTARENLTLGMEYNYTTYDRSESDSRDNHRLIFAVDYLF